MAKIAGLNPQAPAKGFPMLPKGAYVAGIKNVKIDGDAPDQQIVFRVDIIEGEETGDISERTDKLLTAAVMNLALVRLTANKLAGKADVKDFMYMLHPIFAPYYNFSYRKKRKMTISEKEFLLCIDNQKEGVATILKNKKVA